MALGKPVTKLFTLHEVMLRKYEKCDEFYSFLTVTINCGHCLGERVENIRERSDDVSITQQHI